MTDPIRIVLGVLFVAGVFLIAWILCRAANRKDAAMMSAMSDYWLRDQAKKEDAEEDDETKAWPGPTAEA